MEEKMKESLDPDEQLTFYLAERGITDAEFEIAITDRRLIFGWSPLESIPLKEITSASLEWSPKGGLFVGVHFANNKPIKWFPAITREDNEITGSSAWRQEVEEIPREICKVIGVPFAAPRALSKDTFSLRKPRGTVVNFWPKTELRWPDVCPDCMTSLSELSTRYDRIHLNFQGESPTGILDTKFRKPGGNITMEVPYCDECHKKRFKFLKRDPIVNAWHFDGITVTLDFLNEEYAEKFIEINSQPLQAKQVLN